MLLQRGQLLSADEALDAGLVDEVVEEGEETLLSAAAEIDRHLAMPSEHTKWLVKDITRRQLVEMLATQERRSQDCAAFYGMLSQPIVRERLIAYQSSLSTRSSRK